MASLTELYDLLEVKRDVEHIDSVFPHSEYSPEEWPKARLEILTWWKIERLVEDKDCPINKEFALSYFEERLKTTSNLLLQYRYSYFAYLLSANDNRYAKHAIDALLEGLNSLLPEDKEDYPHNAEDAIEILMTLTKRVKHRANEAKDLFLNLLESDYGYRVKLVCMRVAKEREFFLANEAEKIVSLCKDLLPITQDVWREKCCELGLYYASKIQGRSKPYINFFYESLGDMEMEQLTDPDTQPNNIAIPLMNEGHLEKAMGYYQEAGNVEKRNDAEQKFRENKKRVVIPHYKFEKKTDEHVVKYFQSLVKELVEGKTSWLLLNLSLPVRFLFPSFELIRERMPEKGSMAEELGFENRVVDINGNSQKADDDFDLLQKYGIWLMNIVKGPVLDTILTAIHTKKLTYAKLKSWFLKKTCFGEALEYPRTNQVVTTTWFSQIDYGMEALVKQYKRFIQGKTPDWRIPIDLLSIRFEGILRDMVGLCGGHVTKVGKGRNTSQTLLDSLLREPCLKEAFRAEDIEFFEYVFTAKGHNIRNNVAHAFYIPQDYGIMQATLVLLCVLRLTTFRLKEIQNGK